MESISLTAETPSAYFPNRYRRWHVVAGALLLVGVAWLFGAIAEDVATADTITQIDQQLADWLHARATPLTTKAMLAVSAMHGVLPITLATGALALLLLLRRRRRWMLVLLLAVPGGMLLNTLTKFVFARNRPHFDDPIVFLTSYSFPSGHTAGSTLLYGFVAAFLIAHAQSRAARIAIAALALLLVALVASSRIYLGAHFMSDVMAAFFESLAWLTLCGTLVYVFAARRVGRQGV